MLITHAFLGAWLVRDALQAPPERWRGINHCNAALTVIRYEADAPARLLAFNDMTHLPPEMRWTDFPAPLRVPA